MNELTQQGITALKAGDLITARQLFSAALRQNPADLQAWLWMSGAVERDEERLDCLRHIQRIDPGNQTAARGIAQILERNPHLRPKIDQPQRTIEQKPLKPGSAISSILAGKPVQRPPESSRAASTKTPTGPRVIPIIFPRQAPANYTSPQFIFRSRPTLVPSILNFWMMILLLYGALAITSQSELVPIIFPVVLGLAIACGLISLYAIIRLYNTHYELTTELLTIPVGRKKLEIPVWTILTVEAQQSWFQKLLGAGDILVDVEQDGILSRIRIQNITNIQKQVDLLQRLIHEPH